MLNNIPNNTQDSDKAQLYQRLQLPLLCCLAILLCIWMLPGLKGLRESTTEILVQEAPGAASPNGIRKFMNYNGHRYAFIENGARYNLKSEQLGEALGTLELDMMQDPGANGSADFATTFALGGTLYQLQSCSPGFRLAVKLDKDYYIAENVDILGEFSVNLGTYFTVADFWNKTQSIDIYDHLGISQLNQVPAGDVGQMLTLLSQSTPAEFTDEEYQQIGQAQSAGHSFQLIFQLSDGTPYRLYVIPSLSVAMVGDNRYTLPADFAAFAPLFETAQPQPLPQS